MENSIEQSDTNEESGIDSWARFYKEFIDEQDALMLHLIKTELGRNPGLSNIYLNKHTLKDLINFGKEKQ